MHPSSASVRPSFPPLARVAVRVLGAGLFLLAPTLAYAGATTWTGNVSTEWDNSANWSPLKVPELPNQDVVIPVVGGKRYPVLDKDRNLRSLSISNGASLALSGHTLSVQGTLTNAGTIRFVCEEYVKAAAEVGGGSWVMTGYKFPKRCVFTQHNRMKALTVSPADNRSIINLASDLAVQDTLTLQTGTFDLKGFNLSAATVDSASIIQFIGTETIMVQTYKGKGAWYALGNGNKKAETYTFTSRRFHNLEVSPRDEMDTFVFQDGSTVDGEMTVWNGTTLVNENMLLTINGEFRLNFGIFHAAGNVKVSGKTSMRGATYIMSGNARQEFKDFIFETRTHGAFLGGGSAGHMLVHGNFEMSSGSVVLPKNVTFSGNVTKRGGQIDPRVSTVTLDGKNQLLDGAFIFFDFRKVATAEDTLKLGKNTALTVKGALDLEGLPFHILSLRPADGKSAWTLDHEGTKRTLSYLDVNNGHNATASALLCKPQCIDSGGNTGWVIH